MSNSIGIGPAPSLTWTAEAKHVIRMAIPVVITTGSRAIMDCADFVMISRLPTSDAQAAILPAQVMMWSYIVVGIGIASMVNTFASQYLGRGEKRECSRFAWQSVYLAMVFAMPAALLVPIVPRFVAFMGHASGVQIAETAYLKVAILTAGPTIAAGGLGWFFIGIHRPRVTMWSAIEANVVNIVMSAILIFGYCGFKPMGIQGAAMGTLIATIYRTLRLGITLVMSDVDAEFGSRSTWRPSWKAMRRLLYYGCPYGFQWMSEVIVWAIFVNVLVGRMFGTADLIATNATWQYLRIAFLPSMGVGHALTALVGKSIGARDANRAVRQTRICTAMTVLYMGLLAIVYMSFGAKLISFFNGDPEVIRIGRWLMVCAGVFQLFDALGITYTSALRGAGDTFVPSIFFIVSQWILIVGGGWVMATSFPQLGSVGPWIAASMLIIITAIFLWWRWNGRAWMKIDLFAGERNEERLDITENGPAIESINDTIESTEISNGSESPEPERIS